MNNLEENNGGGVRAFEHLEYDTYIRLLRRTFTLLLAYYRGQSNGGDGKTSEEESMAIYAEKFLRTTRLLRLKYGYSPYFRRRPHVEIAGSGFPLHYDIMQLSSDLSSRDERLPKLAPLEVLKAAILDSLMRGKPKSEEAEERQAEELGDLLWQYSERRYLELLNLRTAFFHFTPGKVFPVTEGVSASRRSYYVSWACYDSETNMPHVYFMAFEQDVKDKPFEEPDNPELVKLLETLQHVAGRAPQKLMTIAVRIDESISGIYPKVLKRVSIGPFSSPLLYRGVEIPDEKSFLARARALFKHAGIEEEDFLVFFTTETVTSRREEMPNWIPLLGARKVRQIFYVPKNDQDLLHRGASLVHKYVLMPHRLRQHIGEDILKTVPELRGVEYLVYDPNIDGVHNVG